MKHLDVEKQLIDFISAELMVDTSHHLAVDDELLIDGIIDSIGATRLVGFVERLTESPVPPQDVTVENFGTVRHIVNYLAVAESD